MFATRLRCVSMTPFDRPVVPDEYGSTTTSSRSTGTCSASGVADSAANDVVAVGVADDEHLLDRRVRDRGRGRLEEHRDRHEARRARVDELVVHLVRRVRRVDRGDTPPASATAWKTTPYSGQFGAMTATTSPFASPRSEPPPA